jgi:hypothetical protein
LPAVHALSPDVANWFGQDWRWRRDFGQLNFVMPRMTKSHLISRYRAPTFASDANSSTRETMMERFFLSAALLLTGLALTAHAVDRTFQTEVEKSLQSSVPDRWHLRASWRDKTLVVFVSPPPEEMFKLWYAANEQLETLQKLCRSVSNEVWSKIAPEQDIAMEEVVGGNGGKGSWRLSCRDTLAGRGPDGQPAHATD